MHAGRRFLTWTLTPHACRGTIHVLDYSKLESGFFDIELSDSNLQEALASIVRY